MLRFSRPVHVKLHLQLRKNTLPSAVQYSRLVYSYSIKKSFTKFNEAAAFEVGAFTKSPFQNSVVNFSTKGALGNVSKNSSQNRRGKYAWYFAKVLKIIRIPTVVLSVYVLGYQQGIVDYSRNPMEKRRELMERVLASVGGDSPDKIYFVEEGAPLNALLTKMTVQYSLLRRAGKTGYEKGADRQIQLRNIAFVAERIVRSAKAFVEERLGEIDRMTHPDEFDKWSKAKERIGNVYRNWNFVLIDVPIPNAFVSESLPETIFVTTALLEKFVENDDELGLVLGHEVSHLIYGHMSERNSAAVTLSVIEVVLLGLDPTEGLLSILIVSILASLKSLLDANFSRETEKEADELGIVLAARACFDTTRAPLVFKKMHEHNLEQQYGAVPSSVITNETRPQNIVEDTHDDKTNSAANRETKDKDDSQHPGNWTDIIRTHPPDLERYESLMLASKEEHPNKYSHCTSLKRKLLTSLSMYNSI